jgi:ABC-2 type transport system ATP-binding protein
MPEAQIPVVVTERLRREYRSRRSKSGPVVALDAVDLTVDLGEIHGLLGPNGAGKTTLVKILTTVLTPTSGTARVLGLDVSDDTAALRGRIGLVFGGDRGLYTRLTARQNLEYWAALYEVPAAVARGRADELLGRVGLGERADDRVEEFSRGMKQRLHLARGLVGDPEVLFLDEPTVGLDPMASLRFRELVTEIRDEGRTVFITTHDMSEAEAVCDRVSLIDRGAILATERPAMLGRWINRYEWVEVRDLDDALAARLAALDGVASVTRRADGWSRIQPEADGVAHRVLEIVVGTGITSVRTGSPSLEEVYIHVMGDRGMDL